MANLLRSRITCAVLLCAGLSSPTAILAATREVAAEAKSSIRLSAFQERLVALKPSRAPLSPRPLLEELRGEPDKVARLHSSSPASPRSSKTVTVPDAGNAGSTQYSTTEWDVDADGSVDRRLTIVTNLDAQGRGLRQATKNEDLDFGTVDKSLVLSAYDSRGNVTQQIFEQDPDGDGTADTRATSTWEYNAAGHQVLYVQQNDSPIGGPLELFVNRAQEYDRNGNTIRVEETTEAGPESTLDVTVMTYDQQGRVLTSARSVDHMIDGTLDYTNLISLAYDSRGNLLTVVQEGDLGADGVLDARYTETYQYDQQSNVVESVSEQDDGADGEIEGRRTGHYTIDAQGRLVFEEMISWTPTSESITTWENTYNAQGQLVRTVARDDSPSPGTPDFVIITDHTYDSRGNVLSMVITTDDDDDGIPDRVYRQETERNGRGDVTRATYKTDWDADGSLDQVDTLTYIYDPRGNQTSYTYVSDVGADGVPDYTESQTIRYSRGIDLETPVAGTTDRVPVFRAAAPNPFQEGSSFLFSLPTEGSLELAIYDASGRLVRSLMSGSHPAGEVQAVWDGRDDQARQVPNGAYFARLRAGGQVMTRTLLRLR